MNPVHQILTTEVALTAMAQLRNKDPGIDFDWLWTILNEYRNGLILGLDNKQDIDD